MEGDTNRQWNRRLTPSRTSQPTAPRRAQRMPATRRASTRVQPLAAKAGRERGLQTTAPSNTPPRTESAPSRTSCPQTPSATRLRDGTPERRHRLARTETHIPTSPPSVPAPESGPATHQHTPSVRARRPAPSAPQTEPTSTRRAYPPRKRAKCPGKNDHVLLRPSPRRHQTRAASPLRMDETGQAERAAANAGRQSDTTVLVFPVPPPRSPSGRSPERDLRARRAKSAAAGSLDRRTGDRLPPRPLAADVPGERSEGRFGGMACADPSNPMPPRDPVVGRDDVETCAGGRCQPHWSRRPSAAQPGAECQAASSGTPRMHAGPREHNRRWSRRGTAVCRACPGDEGRPQAAWTAMGRGRCSANLGGNWRPVVCRGCGCRSRDTSRT